MNDLMRWALTVGLFHWTAASVVTPVPMLDCNGLPCVMVTIGESVTGYSRVPKNV